LPNFPHFLTLLVLLNQNLIVHFFIRKTSTAFTILFVCVDDIILAGACLSEIERIKSLVKIKDLGELKYLLVLEVSRSKKGIHLCQRKYTLDIWTETGILASMPFTTLLMSKNKILFEGANRISNTNSYRRLICKLLYLTNTRPRISFVIHLLSQFLQKLTVHHQQAAQHIMCYIKVNPLEGLFFATNYENQVKAFSDSDWASCPKTRQSTTRYCIFLGFSLIS